MRHMMWTIKFNAKEKKKLDLRRILTSKAQRTGSTLPLEYLSNNEKKNRESEERRRDSRELTKGMSFGNSDSERERESERHSQPATKAGKTFYTLYVRVV